jgi:broad specificity phosphatase PhoE
VTRVLLLRHGQSAWNAEGRWQGQADPPLSPLGEQQARAATGALEGVDALYSSDLVRARRTAEILASPGDLEVRIEGRLRERDGGEWTGLTRAEIESRWPGYLSDGRRPPGYEDDPRVVPRALAALERIASEVEGGVVFAVTHGGLIRAVERHLALDDAGTVPNLGGRWLSVRDRTLRAGERHLLIDPDAVEVTVPGLL